MTGFGNGERDNALEQHGIRRVRVPVSKRVEDYLTVDVKRQRAYIAGPMSGYDEFNFPAFYEAAKWLEEQCFEVINPADRGWGDGDPKNGELTEHERLYFYRGAVREVTTADLIVLLPGWEESRGANLELQVARGLGLEVWFFVRNPVDGSHYLRSDEPKSERHPNSARFHQLLEEMGELHDRKQADYGRGEDPFANVRASSEWGLDAWVGAMVRLTDKVRRLQSLAQKGHLVNEAAVDSFMDIAVYAVIARVLFEEQIPV